MIKEDNDVLNNEAAPADGSAKPQDTDADTKTQDLAKASRDDFDPNEGQE